MSTGATHVRDALHAWMTRDAGATLIGEGVGRAGGNAGSTAGLLAAHPARVIDTPIGDRSALGLGLGMALAGRPVCVELSAGRALLAAAELLADAGRMSGSDFAPALTVRVPVGGEAGPAVDASVGALLAALPGVTVSVSTAGTAGTLLAAALGRGVHVILEPRAESGRRADVREVTLGRLAVLRAGTHVTVAAAGAGVAAALDAAESLALDGIDAQVVDLVTISPVDPALAGLVERTGRLIVVHPGDAGVARPALDHALHGAFLYLESPLGDCAPSASAVSDAVRRSVAF